MHGKSKTEKQLAGVNIIDRYKVVCSQQCKKDTMDSDNYARDSSSLARSSLAASSTSYTYVNQHQL